MFTRADGAGAEVPAPGGLGADQLTISGGDATQVFVINPRVTDAIAGLTIADGNANYGNAVSRQRRFSSSARMTRVAPPPAPW
jgi:hypothetical protein